MTRYVERWAGVRSMFLRNKQCHLRDPVVRGLSLTVCSPLNALRAQLPVCTAIIDKAYKAQRSWDRLQRTQTTALHVYAQNRKLNCLDSNVSRILVYLFLLYNLTCAIIVSYTYHIIYHFANVTWFECDSLNVITRYYCQVMATATTTTPTMIYNVINSHNIILMQYEFLIQFRLCVHRQLLLNK